MLALRLQRTDVHQRTVDYPEKFANGYHVMLDSEVLVTVRWEQVVGLRQW